MSKHIVRLEMLYWTSLGLLFNMEMFVFLTTYTTVRGNKKCSGKQESCHNTLYLSLEYRFSSQGDPAVALCAFCHNIK